MQKILKVVVGTASFCVTTIGLQRFVRYLLVNRYDLTYDEILLIKNGDQKIIRKIVKQIDGLTERKIFKLLIRLFTTEISIRTIAIITTLQLLGYFSKEIALYIYDGSIAKMSDKSYEVLKKELFDLTIGVPQCGHVINFAKDLLNHDDLPYPEKERIAEEVVTFVLNMSNDNIKSVAIICLMSLIAWLAISSGDGYYALLRALHRAYREGRISLALYEKILKKLRKYGLSV